VLDSHTEEATIHANLGIAISHFATSSFSINHLAIKIKINNWYRQVRQTYHANTCPLSARLWHVATTTVECMLIEKSPQSIIEDSFQYSDMCMGV